MLEDYSHVTGGVNLNWEDVQGNIYKMALFNADFNGDGILTVEESAMGDLAADYMMTIMDKRLWGRAREIRTGIEFSF